MSHDTILSDSSDTQRAGFYGALTKANLMALSMLIYVRQHNHPYSEYQMDRIVYEAWQNAMRAGRYANNALNTEGV